MFNSPITIRACLVPSKLSGADILTNHTTKTMISEAMDKEQICGK